MIISRRQLDREVEQLEYSSKEKTSSILAYNDSANLRQVRVRSLIASIHKFLLREYNRAFKNREPEIFSIDENTRKISLPQFVKRLNL